MSRTLLAVALVAGAVSTSFARPYYAAKKGLSCAACHVAPSGGGVREQREDSPMKFSDSIALSADFRVLASYLDGSDASNFTLGRSPLAVLAKPAPGVTMVVEHHVNSNQIAQAYGLWKRQEGLPVYAKAGRFFVPYGIQFGDPDDAGLAKGAPYNPVVGLAMAGTDSDTGVEFGLAPKKGYFVNVSVTNGQAGAGGDNDDGKLVTARAGIVREHFMVGATALRNPSGPAASDSTRLRYGPIAWVHAGPASLMYEGGFGQDDPKTGPTAKMANHTGEFTVEPVEKWLGRVRFESIDPDTSLVDDDKQRWTFAVEKFFEGSSLEILFRVNKEKPETRNDQVLLHGHFWF